MKSTRRILMLLIIVPVLTLGAGVVAGMLASRLPAGGPGVSPEERTLLVTELNLNPAQRDQMRQIWEGAQAKVQRTFQQAQDLQSDRERALIALLSDEQKAQFEKIARDFSDRRTELDKVRDKAFQDAVESSKSLMNETQKQKYDLILKSHVGSMGGARPNSL